MGVTAPPLRWRVFKKKKKKNLVEEEGARERERDEWRIVKEVERDWNVW
jgi:hypothetical protein